MNTATVKSIDLAAFMDQAAIDYVLAVRVLHVSSIIMTHAVGWQNLHTYKGFLFSVCSVLHRIAFPVVSGWCQFQVRRLHVAGPFSSTGAEGLGRRPFARQTDHQVSVTLLKPRGESGSSPLRRARFSASNWMGMAHSIGDNSSGSEPGSGNFADA